MKWKNHHTLLLLFGVSGNGKTHCAQAIFAWFIRCALAIYDQNKIMRSHAPSGTFRSWPRIVDGFKEGRYEILDDMFKDDLLILDDVGAEHDPSRNGADKLCQILSQRERKYTVLTCNLAPDKWEDKWDARIADRFARNSVVFDMSNVPSYQTFKTE